MSGEAGRRTPTGGPLEGVSVVELATFMSAPYAGLQLADLGATVIKVEPPSGDPFRRFGRPPTYVAPHWASTNRGKQSVCLDLKTDAGRSKLLALLRNADIFLANWRPKAAESLGLTDEVLREVNPRMIRVLITGFGPTGPARDEPALDTAIQARSGMMDAFAATDAPVVVAGYPIDKLTALIATQATLAALFSREQTGIAERVEVPMLDVAASLSFPDLFPNRVFLDHQPDDPHNRHSMAIRPIRARDGYFIVAPGTGRQIAAAFEAVGRSEWTAEVLAPSDHAAVVTAFFDRFSIVAKAQNVEDLLTLLRRAQVPCARCLRMDEHFDDPQVSHNELYTIADWHDAGPSRMVRYPATFSSWSTLLAGGAPPRLGEHNELVDGSSGDPAT